MKLLYILFVFLININIIYATDITIFYPQDNITTDIKYANHTGYYYSISNNVSDDNFTAIILKNEKEYENVIESPHKIISPIFGLITIIVLFTIFILFVRGIKKIRW